MDNEKFYKRIDSDSGLIKDEIEKNHFVVLQKEQIIRNMLLGEYDDRGTYVIKPEIIAEFVAMPKYFVEELEQIHLVKGTYKADKYFYFSISFDEKGATLNLLEKINFGCNLKPELASYSNIISTKLANIEIQNPRENLEEIYNNFNVSKKPADKIKDFSELTEEERANLLNLLYKVKYNYVRNTLWLKKEKEREISEAEYFNSVIEKLYDLKNFGSSVLIDLDKEFVTKKDLIKFENLFFFLSINDMLNAFLQKNINNNNEQDYEEFLKFYKKIQQKYIEEKIKQLDITISDEELNKTYAELKYENLFNRQILKDKKKLAEFANLVAMNKYFQKLESRGVDIFGKSKKANATQSSTKPLSKLISKAKSADKSKTKKIEKKAEKSKTASKPEYLIEQLQKFSYVGGKSVKTSTNNSVNSTKSADAILLNSMSNKLVNKIASNTIEITKDTVPARTQRIDEELKNAQTQTNIDL